MIRKNQHDRYVDFPSRPFLLARGFGHAVAIIFLVRF